MNMISLDNRKALIKKGYLLPAIILFFFCFLWPLAPVHAQQQQAISPEDAFLAGRLASILEREFGWSCESFNLVVVDGVATIILFKESPVRRSQIENFPHIKGLESVEIVLDPSALPAEKSRPMVCDEYSFLGLKADTIPFPTGDLFWPLIADPKQPQFSISFRHYKTPQANASTAAVGYGETFGLYRRAYHRLDEAFQISISGALFAQFNLDTPSYDLVNADYIIGFPMTYRRGDTSLRVRLYHQSSHLGDEFLLHFSPQRINLSFESLELLVSRRWEPWRIYMGGEYLISREPGELKRSGLHGGLEYYGSRFLGMGQWMTGLDVKSWEENDWSMDISFLAGIEFGKAKPGNRRVRIMAEGYKGHAPHGQFYKDRISYYGLGFYLGF